MLISLISRPSGHDSIGIGEGGPTRNSLETLACLRSIPNLPVIYPGDCNENSGSKVCNERFVSLPCGELFEPQDTAHRESVPPSAFFNLKTVDAPASACLEKFGFTVDIVVAKAKALG